MEYFGNVRAPRLQAKFTLNPGNIGSLQSDLCNEIPGAGIIRPRGLRRGYWMVNLADAVALWE